MKKNNKQIKAIIFISFLVLIAFWGFISCSNPFLKDKKSEGYENQKPETYLFLHFESDTIAVQDTVMQNGQPFYVQDTVITTLDTTASKQELHWWGEDPDGEIIGYYYKWNYESELTFTTEEEITFYVPITQQYDIFDFEVYAVDNDSAVDPVPAKLSFPVFNSFPTINFRNQSNPSVSGNPNVVATTFTTRTFVWDALDPDGNETIMKILWTIDDTTNWNVIERTNGVLQSEITLTENELTEGFHTFYVKALDIANAESDVIMFPDPNDDEVPNQWYVKEPKGEVLLIDDFALDQINKSTQKFYTDVLDQIYGSDDSYSVWEIGSTFGANAVNRQNALPYSTIDIEANMNYFDKVIWFSHLGKPHITEAGLSITKYIKNGGNIFISNGSEQSPDTTWLFTDIDSTYRLNPGGRLMMGLDIPANFEVNDSKNEDLTLQTGQLIGNRVSALIPGNIAGTTAIYSMVHPDSTNVAVPYQGTPAVGILFEPDYIEGKSIYFSLPLNYCYGKENIQEVLNYILNEEFED